MRHSMENPAQVNWGWNSHAQVLAQLFVILKIEVGIAEENR
jgi:hypothetical protein